MPRADRGPGEFFLLWHLAVRKRPAEEQKFLLSITKHALSIASEILALNGITVSLVDTAPGKEGREQAWDEVVRLWTCEPRQGPCFGRKGEGEPQGTEPGETPEG